MLPTGEMLTRQSAVRSLCDVRRRVASYLFSSRTHSRAIATRSFRYTPVFCRKSEISIFRNYLISPWDNWSSRDSASPSTEKIGCRSFATHSKSDSDEVLTEVYPEKGVGVVRLNRPKALNALDDSLVERMLRLMQAHDADPNVKAIVLLGGEKAFAAGADIKEMNSKEFSEVAKTDMLGFWNGVKEIRKPIIAAVNGYALGGGCELAMSCDIIVASETAQFGQPEVLLGTIPGCGGTQRLTHAVGKSKAMMWVLTGDRFSAVEAERAGLVAKVFSPDELEHGAIEMAAKIAKFSSPVLNMAKECVNQALNLPLDQGLLFERRVFHSTWGLADRKEGMTAFAEKRTANFKNE